jgi:gamma-butyrobetaine dioxygenase
MIMNGARMASLPAGTGAAGLPAVWLRHNCRCADCLDPVTGQRLRDVSDLPADLTVNDVSVAGRQVTVRFQPDGHQAMFDQAWLARHAAGRGTADPRTEDAKKLWPAVGPAGTAGVPPGPPPRLSWPRYMADPGYRRACQQAILDHGLILLCDMPTEPGTVLAVAASMGYVRETNYGRLFDVRVEAAPANLAYTSRPIAPHTDNPYRDPVPTVQLLHCLRSAAHGGDSVFADGFRAAAQLRVRDQAAFRTLAGTPVTFSYRDQSTQLSATRPLISLDPRGRIREIRCNGRSLQPPRLSPAEAAGFYAAYRAFAGLASDPAALRTVRLAPGDCVVFDNTRILHGRTGFTGQGGRHLQGCYADLDGVESAVAVAGREREKGKDRS